MTVAALGLILLGFLVGPLSSGSVAVGWLFVIGFYLAAEERVKDQARRDYITDISQAIHDGKIDGDDLRRSRGYKNVEDALRRHDTDR